MDRQGSSLASDSEMDTQSPRCCDSAEAAEVHLAVEAEMDVAQVECVSEYQWQDGRGRWHGYDERTNAELLKAAETGALLRLRLANGLEYDFDLRGLHQLSIDSGRRRPMRLAPSGFQWHCAEGWCDFERRADLAIARAIIEDRSSLHLDLGESSYLLDLVAMKQENLQSGQCRAVRGQEWEWSDARGRWHGFAPEASVKISAALTLQWHSVEIITEHGGLYRIDLQAMEQESCDTGRRRPLRMKRADDGLRGSVSGPAEVAPSDGLGVRTLKVRHQNTGELRRLRTSWPHTASNSEVLDAIRQAVESGFPSLRSPILSYFDDDGDRCGLVLETLEDCLSFACAQVLKLEVSEFAVEKASEGSLPETADHGASEFSISTPRSRRGLLEDEYDAEWCLAEAPKL